MLLFMPQDTSMNGIGKACDNMSQMKELRCKGIM